MIKKVFVIGAGTMGNGIAQVAAEAGYTVTMMDVKEEFVKRGIAAIERSLDRRIKKGELKDENKREILSRITTGLDKEAARSADLVIEAAPEVLALKLDLFRELDGLCPESAILATNTSSLPIGAMSAVVKASRKANVVGIHFMNPVPVMKGVEVIPGRHTSPETLQASMEFVKSLGKEPCEAADYAGFVVTRILDAMMNEAFHCVMDGNKPEQVDKAMKLCCNFPMGPLELCDLVGAEIVLHGLETMQKEFGERLRPSPLLVSMVRSGDLGRKTSRGFYDYTQPKK
jgi:3-hydroxybutyryl-CoA dehydrogenase